MHSPPKNPVKARRHLWPIMAGVAILLVLLAWSLDRSPQPGNPQATKESEPGGPPWRYGNLDARFTLVEYADLECPYCKAYFHVLKQWIDAHPDVNWQWHHFPLSMHEPAATQSARLAECAGESAGRAAFWNAIEWIHQHTLGDGRGLPADAQLPGTTPALNECLASTRPDAVVRAQAEDAAQTQVVATPSLRLTDNHTGKSLRLPPGPVEGDALLSALDLLLSSNDESSQAEAMPEATDMPPDFAGNPPN